MLLDLLDEHTDLKSRCELLHKELKAINGEHNEMNDDLVRLEEKNASNNQQLKELNHCVEQLGNKMDDDIINVEGQIAEHTKNLDNLNGSVESLEDKYESVSIGMATLKNHTFQLEKRTDKLKKEIVGFRHTIPILQTRVFDQSLVQLRNAENSLPVEVFRLKTGTYKQASGTGFMDFTGAVGVVTIPVHRVQYHLSLSGHWVDTAGARVYFRFRFTPQNGPDTQAFYVPDEAGALKYIYVDHGRLEEYSLCGALAINPGTYNVRLQINVVANGASSQYSWDGGSYGHIVLVIS
jgi:archaellum component FlaC